MSSVASTCSAVLLAHDMPAHALHAPAPSCVAPPPPPPFPLSSPFDDDDDDAADALHATDALLACYSTLLSPPVAVPARLLLPAPGAASRSPPATAAHSSATGSLATAAGSQATAGSAPPLAPAGGIDKKKSRAQRNRDSADRSRQKKRQAAAALQDQVRALLAKLDAAARREAAVRASYQAVRDELVQLRAVASDMRDLLSRQGFLVEGGGALLQKQHQGQRILDAQQHQQQHQRRQQQQIQIQIQQHQAHQQHQPQQHHPHPDQAQHHHRHAQVQQLQQVQQLEQLDHHQHVHRQQLVHQILQQHPPDVLAAGLPVGLPLGALPLGLGLGLGFAE